MYIIELGAGSGKFSYFMLKALQEMKDVSDFPVDKIVYVMTDFTENNFKFWRHHPSLKVSHTILCVNTNISLFKYSYTIAIF